MERNSSNEKKKIIRESEERPVWFGFLLTNWEGFCIHTRKLSRESHITNNEGQPLGKMTFKWVMNGERRNIYAPHEFGVYHWGSETGYKLF